MLLMQYILKPLHYVKEIFTHKNYLYYDYFYVTYQK